MSEWYYIASVICTGVGVVWYLSARLTKQDSAIEHIHENMSILKDDVRDIKQYSPLIQNQRIDRLETEVFGERQIGFKNGSN
jgi:hypothetical protein